jgi:hypothetical protein
VLTWVTSGDYGGSLVYVDAETGAVLERVALPVVLDDDGRLSVDAAALRRMNRRLARFVPLASLPIEREETASSEGAPLRVLTRPTLEEEDEPGVHVSVVRASDGARLGEHVSYAEELTGVALVPDGSAVVLSHFHCACECASWSTWVPLSGPGGDPSDD